MKYSSQDILYGRKSVPLRGDMYYLPPMQANQIFGVNETVASEPFVALDLWCQF